MRTCVLDQLCVLGEAVFSRSLFLMSSVMIFPLVLLERLFVTDAVTRKRLCEEGLITYCLRYFI